MRYIETGSTNNDSFVMLKYSAVSLDAPDGNALPVVLFMTNAMHVSRTYVFLPLLQLYGFSGSPLEKDTMVYSSGWCWLGHGEVGGDDSLEFSPDLISFFFSTSCSWGAASAEGLLILPASVRSPVMDVVAGFDPSRTSGMDFFSSPATCLASGVMTNDGKEVATHWRDRS